MYAVIVTIIVLAYMFCDVNYFLRVAYIIGVGKLCKKLCNNKTCNVKNPSIIYGFCTTQDVDIFLNHMNNARYLRELDFARIRFYVETGIYKNAKALNGNILQGATAVRYRRAIPIFTAYKIETRLVYWEGNSLFFEQKFITFDGFIRAIVLSRQTLINVEADTLLQNMPGAEQKPACPTEIKHWLDSIEVSSQRLRKIN